MAATARLVFADSERDADLFWLTGFLAGDPFLYLERDGKKTLFLSDLEVDRGRRLKGIEVVRVKEISDAEEKENGDLPPDPFVRIGRILRRIAADRGIDGFEVPASFPLALADTLRGLGLGVRWSRPPFAPGRTIKSAAEVEKIRGAIRHTEAAMQAALDCLRAAEIRGDALVKDGRPLTSEDVRLVINRCLMERSCHAYEAIVAGGDQGVDPHERGHGPLPAHLPIILDIFPRDNATRYHGDMTRTVVRGKASAEAKRMFEAVKEAKAAAEAVLRDGADGFDAHDAVKKVFEKHRFETAQRDGRMVGFFHGTGHGLGLEVHEHPRVSQVHEILKAGHVVTVEPGLYYPGVGGVRLEDDVLVTKDGCENLCTMPVEPFEI